MNISHDVNIEVNIPKDNFYLQWDYIFWWQVKINIEIAISEGMKKFMEQQL